MRSDKNAAAANNILVSNSELGEEIDRLGSLQEAAVPEYDQIDSGADQNEGQTKTWHSFDLSEMWCC